MHPVLSATEIYLEKPVTDSQMFVVNNIYCRNIQLCVRECRHAMPRHAYSESHVNILIFLKLKDPCIQPLTYTTLIAVKYYNVCVLLHLLPKMNWGLF